MIIFLDGPTKSGKSYYAVNYIHDNLNSYSHIYTNINGMKLTDKIRPLNFDKIMEIVSNCHDLFQNASSDLGKDDAQKVIELDDFFIDYLLEIGFLKKNPLYDKYLEEIKERKSLSFFQRTLLNTTKPIKKQSPYLRVLVVIDEASNYFEPRSTNKLLLWFLSYHAHLFLDIILMSQDPEDIHKLYRNRVHFFLHAMDGSQGIFNFKFRYQKHLKYPFNMNPKYGAFVGNVKLKKKQEIFNMYKAGDKQFNSSTVLPYVLISLAVLLFLVFSVVLIQRYAFGESEPLPEKNTMPKKEHIQKQTARNVVTAEATNNSYKGFTYIKFNCLNSVCKNTLNNIEFNIDDLQGLLDNTDSKYLHSTKIGKSFANVYLLVSSDFINLFLGAKKNEKNNNGFSFLN